jgi:hypothetical protein
MAKSVGRLLRMTTDPAYGGGTGDMSNTSINVWVVVSAELCLEAVFE